MQLVRVLARQTNLSVGLVQIDTIAQGEAAVRQTFSALRVAGKRILIVDALQESDLRTIGAACSDMPLVTGGSGFALGLAANFVKAGRVTPRPTQSRMEAPSGRSVVLAGSCSVATRVQIAAARAAGFPLVPYFAPGDPEVPMQCGRWPVPMLRCCWPTTGRWWREPDSPMRNMRPKNWRRRRGFPAAAEPGNATADAGSGGRSAPPLSCALIQPGHHSCSEALKASAWSGCQRDSGGRLSAMSPAAQRMRFSSVRRSTSLSGHRM